MKLGYVYDDRFLRHDAGPSHVERPDRLRSIMAMLREQELLAKMHRIEAATATVEQVQRVHSRSHIQRMAELCKRAPALADAGDTRVSAESYDVAMLAGGGAIAAADAVMAGTVDRAFCIHRPPGHHAEHDHAMGFCLFNHVAVVAEHLRANHELQRIAIVDFDVHHGNGTQHHFESRADVLFISLHQHPRTLYPGTGFAEETGKGEGEGFTLNVPMMPGAADGEYEKAMNEKVVPKLDAFKPQAMLISAGFDAMAEDPLAQIELTADAFTRMTRLLVEVARRHAGNRVISVLEGGYDLDALARAATAHVRALME